MSELVRRLEAEADKIESGAGMPTHVGAGLRVAIRIVEQFEFEGGYQADADLLDDIRRAGCPTTLPATGGQGTLCRWCYARSTGLRDAPPHEPGCLWLRIEARGERS